MEIKSFKVYLKLSISFWIKYFCELFIIIFELKESKQKKKREHILDTFK